MSKKGGKKEEKSNQRKEKET